MSGLPARVRRIDAATLARLDRVEAVVFTAVLLAFSITIVASATGLKSGPAAIPLAIGVPTVIGLVVQLVRDLRRAGARRAAPTVEGASRDTPVAVAPGSGGMTDWLELGLEEEQAAELPTTAEARVRQVVLAAWIVGYVALGVVAGMLVATPPALFAILLVATRRPLVSLVIAAVTSAACYLVFVQVLGVPF